MYYSKKPNTCEFCYVFQTEIVVEELFNFLKDYKDTDIALKDSLDSCEILKEINCKCFLSAKSFYQPFKIFPKLYSKNFHFLIL